MLRTMSVTPAAKLFAVLLLILLAACLSTLLGTATAQASQCYSAGLEGDWVVSGSAPNYPGSQVSYTLGALRIHLARCVDAGETKCWGEGAERVCSTTSAVRPIFTVGVGEVMPNLSGRAEIAYWPAVEAANGNEGWLYADSTVEGNPTRTWFRSQADSSLQGVIEVWINGQYQGAQWCTFVHPRPFNFPIDPLRPIGL